MNFLDVFSLFVLLVIIGVAVAVVLVLAWLPGNIAKKRHSPWTDAINVSGWSGMLLGIVLGLMSPTLSIIVVIWMLALVAAFIKPRTGEGAAIAISESESKELAISLEAIAKRIAGLESSIRNAGLRADPFTRR